MSTRKQSVSNPEVSDLSGSTANNLSDREAVTLCLTGNTAAFEILVRRYEHRLFGFLYTLTSDVEHSRDLAQDTFIRAWRKLHLFDCDRLFRNWLFAIARNLLRSSRGRSREIPFSDNGNGSDPLWPHPGPSPDAGIEAEERRSLLREALAGLPAEQRRVLILKDIQELQYAEIARILGLPPGTVASRVYCARRALARDFERLYGRIGTGDQW